MKLRAEIKHIPNSLEEIFSDDDLGLFADVQAPQKKKTNSNDPAVNNFLELVEFVHKNGREPKIENSEEKFLAVRLNSYRTRKALAEKVREYDSIGLLKDLPEEPVPAEKKTELPESLDDIFADDDLGLLDDVDSSIYQIKHVTKLCDRELPDEIATYKPCEDFFKFEKLFQDVHDALKNGKVTAVKFRQEGSASVGSVFLLRGMLCYVESMLKDYNQGTGRYNPRYRVIFENGTEADLLKRSLARALFKDPHGKTVSFRNTLISESPLESITSKDRITGYVYVLASKSESSALSGYIKSGRLVKIGYTTQQVENRIKNAEDESTFLEAPVEIKAILHCYNLNPQKFENLVHTFLYRQRLNIKLISKTGKTYFPKEWFTVDWETAVAVCEHIIQGTITQYRMDNVSGKIVER